MMAEITHGARELQLPFIEFRLDNILRGIVGESGQRLRQALELIDEIAPAVVFIDEIDALGSRNEVGTDSGVGRRILNTLLTWMQRNRKAIIVATTNEPDLMDQAMMRPGRIDFRIPLLYPVSQ